MDLLPQGQAIISSIGKVEGLVSNVISLSLVPSKLSQVPGGSKVMLLMDFSNHPKKRGDDRGFLLPFIISPPIMTVTKTRSRKPMVMMIFD